MRPSSELQSANSLLFFHLPGSVDAALFIPQDLHHASHTEAGVYTLGLQQIAPAPVKNHQHQLGTNNGSCQKGSPQIQNRV